MCSFMDLVTALRLLLLHAMKRVWVLGLAMFGLAVAAACGGSTQCAGESCSDATSSSSGASGTTSGSSSTSSGSTGVVTSGRVPKNHRATATPCDGVRPDNEPTGIPDGGTEPNGYIECRTNAECTKGKNGRCNGNGHDGWRCTYDACQTDNDCTSTKGSVCQCEGGFRADNDVCLEGGCRVDADCGANGFCSPTLGDCGNYTGTLGYFCHQPGDECVDDEDCAGATGPIGTGSCRYNKMVGHWRCETSECAG